MFDLGHAGSTRLSVYTQKIGESDSARGLKPTILADQKSRVQHGSRITLIAFTQHKIAGLSTARVSNPRAESLCKHGISFSWSICRTVNS